MLVHPSLQRTDILGPLDRHPACNARAGMDSKLHDHGYAYLFADPEMVRQLLETCVDEDWVRDIEIEKLSPLPTTLIDRRLIRRENDLLLQARYRGREAYVLIMLEFQSTPDRFMTVRLLAYTCLVWLALVERSRKAKGEPTLRRLPPIFPVVLYNGEGAWKEPRRLEELVACAKRGDLWAYVPRYTHHLIEARSFSVGRLEEVQNLISALFTLEGAGDLDLEERTARVVRWLRIWVKRNPELVRRFFQWMRVRFHADNRRDGEVKVEEITAPGGVEMNLDTLLKQRDEKIRQEVREEARREEREQTARKLLARGMDAAEVAEVMGLSLEEVQRLGH